MPGPGLRRKPASRRRSTPVRLRTAAALVQRRIEDRTRGGRSSRAGTTRAPGKDEHDDRFRKRPWINCPSPGIEKTPGPAITLPVDPCPAMAFLRRVRAQARPSLRGLSRGFPYWTSPAIQQCSPRPTSPDHGEETTSLRVSRRPQTETAGGLARLGWLALGLLATGLGFVGIAIPGLPSTVFFIAAAACFARSSPALLDWILRLPKVGPLVRDYRAGLGMPAYAKITATAFMVLAGSFSLAVIHGLGIRLLVLALLATGAGVIWLRIPTSRPPRSARRRRPDRIP